MLNLRASPALLSYCFPCLATSMPNPAISRICNRLQQPSVRVHSPNVNPGAGTSTCSIAVPRYRRSNQRFGCKIVQERELSVSHREPKLAGTLPESCANGETSPGLHVDTARHSQTVPAFGSMGRSFTQMPGGPAATRTMNITHARNASGWGRYRFPGERYYTVRVSLRTESKQTG